MQALGLEMPICRFCSAGFGGAFLFLICLLASASVMSTARFLPRAISAKQ